MADHFQFIIDGHKELMEAFDQLPRAVGKSVMVGALKAAAKPIADEAARLAPEGPTGDLKKSIKIGTKLAASQASGSAKGAAAVFIGPSRPAGSAGVLVEFGTGPRYQTSTGKYVGQMPAEPFLRPAFDTRKEAALKILREIVWEKLKGAAKNLAKRAAKGTLSKSTKKFFGG